MVEITPEQGLMIDLVRTITLNEQQMEQLELAVGKSASAFYVYDSREGENDCTCNTWNIALRFSQTHIEIPNQYIVTNEEAAIRQQEVDAM